LEDVPDDWRNIVDDPRAAELHFRDEIRSQLSDYTQGSRAGLVVDAVGLEGAPFETRLVVEFRAERRYPGCRYRWKRSLWADTFLWDDAIFWANLEEMVEAADIVLPADPGRLIDVA
jgi:hypothetical protein